MHYLYIDFETRIGPGLSLTSMTLRDYLAATDVLSVGMMTSDPLISQASAYAANDTRWPQIVDQLRTICADPDWTIVAHNASFDVRVLVQKLGCPWPQHVHCTMELAQAWSPNQPGGYSLDNLSRLWLPQHQRKAHIDLMRCSEAELLEYNAQDVVACRGLHKLALARLSADELAVHEMTQQIKELTFTVDATKVQAAVQTFAAQANQAAEAATQILGDSDGFNYDGGDVRSVKPADIKNLLLANLGFEAPSISEKKLNPERLRRNANAATAIKQVAAANKALSHKRRVRAFSGISTVDCELTYFAAHTGRFSSRNSGKGLNLHNCVSVRIPVLTHRGWVSIFELNQEDYVWDGEDFVPYQGVRLSPRRDLHQPLAACATTPEHPIWTGHAMVAMADLLPMQQVQSSAAGLCSLLQAAGRMSLTPAATDAVACSLAQSIAYLQAAVAAAAGIDVDTITMPGDWTTVLSASSGADTTTCSIATVLADTASSLDRLIGLSPTGETCPPSYETFAPCLDGMTRICTWIASTVASRTDPAMYASCLQWLTHATVALQSALPRAKSLRSTPHGLVSPISGPTTCGEPADLYDVLGAGPRARFQAGGLIVSNCPKRNPLVAKPVRGLFALDDGLVFVRGDFANVEYRIEGLLTGCAHVNTLFSADVLADPYSMFWTTATGQPCSKKDPVRQLAKAAVLGLGYLMGIRRWMEELLRGLADPTFGVTLADLDAVCRANGWGMPSDPRVKAAMTMLNAPWQVATVAYETRERFHRVHPEFARMARWLERAVGKLAGALDPARASAQLYAEPHAPNPKLIELVVDDVLQGRSVRVRCGPGWSSPTVTWRDLMVRTTPLGTGMTFVRAGNRPPARASLNTLIENIVQSAARNALCQGLLELKRRGHPYILHVHDEVMIVTHRTPAAMLAARQDMIDVFGPGGWISRQGWDWAVVVKPDDITMSRTLYDDEKWSQQAWAKLMTGDASPLGELP